MREHHGRYDLRNGKARLMHSLQAAQAGVPHTDAEGGPIEPTACEVRLRELVDMGLIQVTEEGWACFDPIDVP